MAPRGATRLPNTLRAPAARVQNSPMEGQQSTLKLSFAKDRFGQLAHTAGANGLAEGQQDLLAQVRALGDWGPGVVASKQGGREGGDWYHSLCKRVPIAGVCALGPPAA